MSMRMLNEVSVTDSLGPRWGYGKPFLAMGMIGYKMVSVHLPGQQLEPPRARPPVCMLVPR